MRHGIREVFEAPHYFQKQEENWFYRKEGFLDYWNAPNGYSRKMILEEVWNVAKTFDAPQRILEYGAYSGINLKLIKDKMPSAELYAVEPNRAAYNFMVQSVPLTDSLWGGHKEFIRSHKFNDIDVSFVNSVFYSMSPKNVSDVLSKIYEMSEFLIVCDDTRNMDDRGSRVCYALNEISGKYVLTAQHNYIELAKWHGWKLMEKIDFESGQKTNAGSGILVFRK